MNRLSALALLVVFASTTPCQTTFPGILWYRFDNGDTTNSAIPGGLVYGNGVADPSMLFQPANLCGYGQGGALASPAQAATTQIDTSWSTDLGSSGWTVGMHLDATANNGFQYLFGDATAGNFRCWLDGSGNATLSGPFPSVTIAGGGSGTSTTHVAWCYDPSVPEIRGYLTGSLNVTVPVPSLVIAGSGSPSFTVGRLNNNADSMRAGVIIDDFRFYRSCIDTQFPGNELDQWVTTCITNGTAPGTGGYQQNQAGAGMDINGVISNGWGPAVVEACVGETVNVTYQSNLPNAPWGLMLTGATSLLAAGQGGTTLPSGQIVNMNLTHPTFQFVNGTLFTGPPASLTFPFSTPFAAPAVEANGQTMFLSPTSPDFVVLSQAVALRPISSPAMWLNLGDDDSDRIDLATLSPCLGDVSFCGTTYTEVHVNSNGSCSFGVGDPDFTATAGEFASGPPRLAGMWTDLSPNAGGDIVVKALDGTLVVCFDGVPEFGTAVTSSVQMILETSTSGLFPQAQIEGYAPGAGHGTPTLVGLTCGGPGGATNPGSVTFANLVGNPINTTASPTDMVYQFVGGGAPSGFCCISWPGGDPSTYTVQ